MLSPQQIIDTADGLMGLAAIVGNPDAYQAKLDELKKHATEGNEAFVNSQAALKEAKELNEEALSNNFQAQAIKAQLDSDKSANEASTKENINNLTAWQASLEVRETAVKQAEDDLTRLKNGVAARESAANQALEDLKARKATLESELEKAYALKQDYEVKTAKLIAAVG